jgi:transposase-like protein
MGASDIAQIQSTARILLICPDCGQQNSEYADTLREKSSYYCSGDDCDYIFDLAGPRRSVKSFAEACKRFYAAFYALRPRAR